MINFDSLEGRAAFVTGGTSAMGKGIARALLDKGAKVFLADLSPEKLRDTKNELEAETDGGCVDCAELDLLVPGSAERAFNRAVESFGKIDILINNAGVCLIRNVMELSDRDIDTTFGVNVKGLLNISRLFAKRLIAGNLEGNIVNIASNAAKITFSDQTDYCASKAAIVNITQSLAKEWAKYGINVNAVCPGAVDTDMLLYCMEDAVKKSGGTVTIEDCRRTWGAEQLGRLAQPVEIGRVVAFLSGKAAVVIRGQAINVDAGATAY